MDLALGSTSEAKKRRSIRLVQAVPLVVTGVDALGQAFRERTSTFMISCHGCRYESKHHVLKGSWVTLTIPHGEADRKPRSLRARVTWLLQPDDPRGHFVVSVELETPGNVWGVVSPPADWFPFPETTVSDGATLALPVLPAAGIIQEGPAGPLRDNVRTMPLGGVAEATLAHERPGKRVVEGDREQLQAAAQEKWENRLNESIEQAVLDWTARLGELEQENRADFERHLKERIQQTAEDLRRAAEGSSSQSTQLIERLEQLRRQVEDTTAAVLQRTEHRLQGLEGEAHRHLSELQEGVRQSQDQLASDAGAARSGWQSRLDVDLLDATRRWNKRIETSLRAVVEEGAETLRRGASAATEKLGAEADSRMATIAKATAELESKSLALSTAPNHQNTQAQQALRRSQEGLVESSQKAVQATLSHVHETIGTLERQLGESVRTALARCLEEIDTRATDITHSTFERLFKAAGWYEAKIQTQMRATLDMGLEQARASLGERAKEVSGLLAAEVDQYSRSHAESTQGQLEEFARGLLERVRQQSVDLAAASAANAAKQTLDRLEAALQEMKAQAAQVHSALQPEIERLSAEFRALLAQSAQQALGSAQQDLAFEVEALKVSLRSEIQMQKDWARQALDHLRNLLSPDSTTISSEDQARGKGPTP